MVEAATTEQRTESRMNACVRVPSARLLPPKLPPRLSCYPSFTLHSIIRSPGPFPVPEALAITLPVVPWDILNAVPMLLQVLERPPLTVLVLGSGAQSTVILAAPVSERTRPARLTGALAIRPTARPGSTLGFFGGPYVPDNSSTPVIPRRHAYRTSNRARVHVPENWMWVQSWVPLGVA